MTVRAESRRRTADLERALSESEKYYLQTFESHGPNPQGVGWKDVSSQLLRFEKLAYVLNPGADESVTVNDFGCGYGALYGFLSRLGRVPLERYYGYDACDAVLHAARAQADARATFIHGREISNDADYSFVSGTLNVKGSASSETWTRYVENVIDQLAAHSRVGFAFNLMTSYVDFMNPNLFYANPAHFFSYCKSRISRYVTLLHDYPLYEWTMVVRMAEPTSADRQ